MTPMLGAPLVVVVAAYLLGTFPTAALIGRMTGHDPTAEGSGNPGATNVLRTSGRGAGVAVLAIDVAKGALAVGLGLLVGDHTLGVITGAPPCSAMSPPWADASGAARGWPPRPGPAPWPSRPSASSWGWYSSSQWLSPGGCQ